MSKTPKFRYMKINSSDILISTEYQRTFNVTKAMAIASNFNPNIVNPIKVSERDGKYYAFDGQHTLAALKMKNKNEHLRVDCKVYFGLTKENEAALFAAQNGISTAVGMHEKLRARYVAKDKEIVELYDIINSLGFKFDFTKGKENNKIVACAKVYKIFQAVPREDFITILNLVKDSWSRSSESLKSEILGGMYIFYTTYKSEIDIYKAVNQLSKVQPNIIIRDGKAVLLPGDKRYALQMVKTYNKGLRKGRLDEVTLQLS